MQETRCPANGRSGLLWDRPHTAFLPAVRWGLHFGHIGSIISVFPEAAPVLPCPLVPVLLLDQSHVAFCWLRALVVTLGICTRPVSLCGSLDVGLSLKHVYPKPQDDHKSKRLHVRPERGEAPRGARSPPRPRTPCFWPAFEALPTSPPGYMHQRQDFRQSLATTKFDQG
jgi:hypothetical protein